MPRGRTTQLKVVLLVGCIVTACSPPPDPDLAPKPEIGHAGTMSVGCWVLHPLGWKSDFLPEALPIRLLAEPADTFSSSPWLQVHLDPPRDSAYHWRSSKWAPFARVDSIYVVLGDGFSGVALSLHPNADSLSGRGQTFTDFSAPSRQGRVSATRATCPGGVP